ncbi:MAG: 3-oxoacyl-ACP reductase FabG [Proteobacteria bacterium]|nr:3-oxoacyl-ACP reductase FabG [Pseudomonadota bacterium]
MELTGRTALVTGSSRGIGRAIAIRLAREGAAVAVNYLGRAAQAAEVVELIENSGGKAASFQADVSDYVQVEAMVGQVARTLGPIDVLVNNAMIHRGRAVHKLPLEDWDIVIKSSLYGTFHCCRAVVPSMIERKWGRIINISSPVGLQGYPGDSAYAAAKAGQLGLTKSVARELAPHGVTVNAVMPGFVLTETTQHLSPKNIELFKAGIPLGRLCTGEDVAETVNFLAAKGDYVTGSFHYVDGGLGM